LEDDEDVEFNRDEVDDIDTFETVQNKDCVATKRRRLNKLRDITNIISS
jgi:hypothetical protein